ncbi:hypothetical protein SAMN05660706_11826 [Desulfoscipio geothermicus DSM 3669]|uniref:Uncharacterized protein n=1 Tax=Desulfoscipio geothermicus DSM 3669 TaxID=1121426 RepID=A0A1I6DV16_9FIRM|nr:hypothetical protein SAMN05660706_11826 [Desulfoscipio geothermicus DSM 3669]
MIRVVKTTFRTSKRELDRLFAEFITSPSIMVMGSKYLPLHHFPQTGVPFIFYFPGQIHKLHLHLISYIAFSLAAKSLVTLSSDTASRQLHGSPRCAHPDQPKTLTTIVSVILHPIYPLSATPLICSRIALAAAAGSGAPVIGRPITM